MFKFLLAFLVWLFATGKYQDWYNLIASSVTQTSTTGSTSSASSSGGNVNTDNLLGALGALGSLSGNGTTDSQLLGPMGYSPSDSGVPK